MREVIYLLYNTFTHDALLNIDQVLSVFFSFAYLWTETVYKGLQTHIKEFGQYPAILINKGFDFRVNFSCGTQRVVPSG